MDATYPLWRSVISKIRARSTLSGDAFHEHLKVFGTPAAMNFNNRMIRFLCTLLFKI